MQSIAQSMKFKNQIARMTNTATIAISINHSIEFKSYSLSLLTVVPSTITLSVS